MNLAPNFKFLQCLLSVLKYAWKMMITYVKTKLNSRLAIRQSADLLEANILANKISLPLFCFGVMDSLEGLILPL